MSIFDDYQDLQQFKRKHHTHKPDSSMSVTIYKYHGRINLSKSAYIALGYPKYVALHYSREKHICLIQRAIQSDTGALRIYPGGEATQYYYHAKQFCVMAGLSLNKFYRFEAVLKDGMLVVDLREEDGAN